MDNSTVYLVTGLKVSNIPKKVLPFSVSSLYIRLKRRGPLSKHYDTPDVAKGTSVQFQTTLPVTAQENEKVEVQLLAKFIGRLKADRCIGSCQVSLGQLCQSTENAPVSLQATDGSREPVGQLSLKVTKSDIQSSRGAVSPDSRSSARGQIQPVNAELDLQQGDATDAREETQSTTNRANHSETRNGSQAASLRAQQSASTGRLQTTPGLPYGWERRTDPQGRTFYLDHTRRITSWTPPPPTATLAEELPPGWEQRADEHGRVYYVDHNTRSTTWQRPTRQHVQALQQWQQRNMSVANENFQNRSLFGISTAPRSPQSSTNQPPSTASPTQPPWGNGTRETANWQAYLQGSNQQRTQWMDPRPRPPLALPPGWQQAVTPQGRVYFIDHNTRRTTYEDPRLNSTIIAQANASMPKHVRDFKEKMAALRYFTPLLPGQFRPVVRRDNLFQDAYEQIMAVPPATLRRRLMVAFKGEEGLDYGGVAKEFFFKLSHEVLNPNYGLFQFSNDAHTNIQINPLSGVNPEHLQYFRFVGRIVGMAIYHGHFIDVGFTLPFYKMVLGKPLGLADLELVDPEFFKSLKWLLENNIDDLGLAMTFSMDYDVYGQTETHELKSGGKDIEVNDSNKTEYAHLVAQWRLVRGIESQWQAFMTGFDEVIDVALLLPFDEKELEVMICGVAEIDVNDWQQHTIYRNYSPNEEQIVWLWKAIGQFDNEKRVRLLQFTTGTCRLPLGGFRELQGNNGPQPFCVEKVGQEDWLPRSSTCFNRLCLPPYKSYEQLLHKLTVAIEETSGFGQE